MLNTSNAFESIFYSKEYDNKNIELFVGKNAT